MSDYRPPARPRDPAVTRLQRQISEIESELARQGALLAVHPIGGEKKDDEDRTPVDEVWSCTKCSARLGFYDRREDILRVRHKDFVSYTHLGGPGGFIRILCRGCGEMNELKWVDPGEVAEAS